MYPCGALWAVEVINTGTPGCAPGPAAQAVGFDMDYTLAQYRPETFEALAHKETVEKLVSACCGQGRGPAQVAWAVVVGA